MTDNTAKRILAALRASPTPLRARQVRDAVNPQMSYGEVYCRLMALERDGMVSSFLGEPLAKRGGRRTMYWQLSGGRRELPEAYPKSEHVSMRLVDA